MTNYAACATLDTSRIGRNCRITKDPNSAGQESPEVELCFAGRSDCRTPPPTKRQHPRAKPMSASLAGVSGLHRDHGNRLRHDDRLIVSLLWLLLLRLLLRILFLLRRLRSLEDLGQAFLQLGGVHLAIVDLHDLHCIRRTGGLLEPFNEFGNVFQHPFGG